MVDSKQRNEDVIGDDQNLQEQHQNTKAKGDSLIDRHGNSPSLDTHENQTVQDLSSEENESRTAEVLQAEDTEQEDDNQSESFNRDELGRSAATETKFRKKNMDQMGNKQQRGSKHLPKKKDQFAKAHFFPEIKTKNLIEQRESVRTIARQIGAMTNARAKELSEASEKQGMFVSLKLRKAEHVLFDAIDKRAARIDKLCNKMEEMQEVFNRPKSKGVNSDLELLQYEVIPRLLLRLSLDLHCVNF
eukprot:765359-Hanusia_phi.AAC.3